MSTAGIDIEWIVREVVRRLREQASVESHTNGHRSEKPTAATRHIAGQLTVDDRVVTLATLEKRLEGIQQLHVSPKAIVTPAVRDELKDRNISLVRGGKSDATVSTKEHSTPSTVIGLAIDNFDAGALAKMLGGTPSVVNHPPQRLADLVGEVSGKVAGGTLGVVLAEAPAAAVVMANRHAGVRAAYGFNFPAVRRAVSEVGANLLVLQPAGKSLAELAGMIGEFTRGGERSCPESLRTQIH